MTLTEMADLRPEDLTGRTWAGYIRESTRGQGDRYGPDIQRNEQRRYAERYGLAPTGREYVDLVSGKDTLRRSDFVRMVADAETGSFEVLLCYDTSRFARNIGQPYEYRDRLSKAGVVIVFCSDGLNAGNVDTFEVEGLKTSPTPLTSAAFRATSPADTNISGACSVIPAGFPSRIRSSRRAQAARSGRRAGSRQGTTGIRPLFGRDMERSNPCRRTWAHRRRSGGDAHQPAPCRTRGQAQGAAG